MGRGNYKKRTPAMQDDVIKVEEESIIGDTSVPEELKSSEPVIIEAEPVIEEPVQEIIQNPLYSVQVNHPSLRRRAQPNINSPVVGLITDNNVYDIFELQGEWGRLNDGSWIMLSFTKKV